jgi:hypothetical protein
MRLLCHFEPIQYTVRSEVTAIIESSNMYIHKFRRFLDDIFVNLKSCAAGNLNGFEFHGLLAHLCWLFFHYLTPPMYTSY